MSLIPSESLSFPDDFSRAITRARALSEAKTTAALLNARSKRARVRAVPPAPIEQPQVVPAAMVIPAAKPVATKTPIIKASISAPAPAPVKVVAPKPVLPIRPGPVAQLPVVPAPMVIPAPKPVATKLPPIKAPIPNAEPTPAPIKIQAPKPAMVKAAPNEQLQQRLALQPAPETPQPIKLRPRALAAAPTNGDRLPKEQQLPPQPQRRQGPIRLVPKAPIAAHQVPSVPLAIEPAPEDTENERESRTLIRIHGRRKWKRFILIESIALGVLVPTAASALSHYFVDPVAVLAMNVLTIAAALVAGVVPILFFAIAPTLPRTER